MIVTNNISLDHFEFWGNAQSLAKNLTTNEFATIEAILEDTYPDGISATDLNDMFFFDGDTIAEWLGYEKEDDILFRNDPEFMFEKAARIIRDYADGCEFDFNDVAQYLADKNITKEDFVNGAWKQYVAEEYENIPIDDVDEDAYEDAIWYLKKILFTERIDKTIQDKTFLSEMIDEITEEIQDMSCIPYTEQNRVDKFVDDLNALDLGSSSDSLAA